MTRRFIGAAVAITAAAVWTGVPHAQGQRQAKGNWLTDGADSQRTSWQRNERFITPASVKNMKLLWTLQLDNAAAPAAQPLPAADRFATCRRRRVPARWGSSPASPTTSTASTSRRARRSGSVTSTARFRTSREGEAAYPLCPGGLTATPVIAPTDTPGKFRIYAISWDGRLRQLDVATGEELAPAEPFLPPNGKPYGLNLYKNVLYTTTAQGCGGNPNQFYALRPRDEEGRQLQSRQRRAVAAARSVDRKGRHASTPAAATATTSRRSRSTGRRSSR